MWRLWRGYSDDDAAAGCGANDATRVTFSGMPRCAGAGALDAGDGMQRDPAGKGPAAGAGMLARGIFDHAGFPPFL